MLEEFFKSLRNLIGQRKMRIKLEFTFQEIEELIKETIKSRYSDFIQHKEIELVISDDSMEEQDISNWIFEIKEKE